MKFTEGMRSSNTDNWPTPKDLFDNLDKEFHFTLDVCASKDNAKCPRYFDITIDGLSQDWNNEICWMNPPYGRSISYWVEKAYNTGLNGGLVVALLPSRTDTRWFHDYVIKANEIRFIKGRLKFGNAKSCAPFPSLIAVFGCVRND